MPLSRSCNIMASAAPPSPAASRLLRSPRSTKHSLPRRRRLPTLFPVVLAVLLCFASRALAAPTEASQPIETLVIDPRTPFREGRGWVMLSEQDVQLRRARRAAASESSESSEPSKTSSETDSVTTTQVLSVGTQKPSAASTSVPPSPLPSILDSLSNGFVKGPNDGPAPCPIFIKSFLDNPTFKSCYPLALLFDGSKSFFEAQKSLVSITRTLDATCAANVATCTTYMNDLAKQFIATENCGADFARGTPTVVDAYEGMLAYSTVYTVGCLKDPDTSAYCYANAVTNLTNPSMTHIYFLPLNKTLPGNTVPACNYCLQQTMAIYQAATADRRQPIAQTYVNAAGQVNTICGPDFANQTLAAVVIGAAGRAKLAATWLPAALPLLAAVLWLG